MMSRSVGTAKSAGVHAYQHLVGVDPWVGGIAVGEVSWGVVDDGFHGKGIGIMVFRV